MKSIYIDYIGEDSSNIRANSPCSRTFHRTPCRLALRLRAEPRNGTEVWHPLSDSHAPGQVLLARNQVDNHRGRCPTASHLPAHSNWQGTSPGKANNLRFRRAHSPHRL